MGETFASTAQMQAMKRETEAQMVSAAEAIQAAQGMAAAVGSTNLGPGQDQITDALSKMPRAALFDIMAQMKGLIQQNQQQARQILVTNPSLTRALFQAQILLGMLKNPLSADATAQPGPPPAAPQLVPQPAPAPQQQFPPPHMQSQHQLAPAMRPQHAPSANPITHFPPQDMQSQAPPQQQQQGGSLPGAPQSMRHAPGQSMPGRGARHPGPAQGGPGPGPVGMQTGPGPVGMQTGPAGQQYGGPMQGPPVGQAGQGMQGPGPGPGQVPVRRPHDPRMRGADPRQQAHPRPAQPIQQPQPNPQPQPAPAANLPAEQQKVLLNQIMQLSPAQIDGLPHEQKAQVLALQQQMVSLLLIHEYCVGPVLRPCLLSSATCIQSIAGSSTSVVSVHWFQFA
ncbi:hypothetical protein ABBQ32_002527 [Trebouxia sp. C0010 RCD-2024]